MIAHALSSAPRARRGLTLIETIVTIFVFSLLVLTITQLLTGGIRAWQRGNTRMKLRADARDAIDQIQADFRQFTGDLTLGNFVPQPASPQTKSGQLLFKRYRNPNSTSTSAQVIQYFMNTTTNQIVRTDGDTNTNTVVAENVVVLDTRDNVLKSYFQWEDATNTTMGIYLYLEQDATTQLAAGKMGLESVSLQSGAFWVGQGVPNANTAHVSLPLAASTPSSLRDPRGAHPFRGRR